MLFCPKCGSILIPRERGGKKVLACSCGYVHEAKEDIKIKEVVETPKEKKDIEPINEEIEPYPLVDVECPHCHNGKAYFWTVQTRAGDEPETKFYKCQKCKHIWRDYG